MNDSLNRVPLFLTNWIFFSLLVGDYQAILSFFIPELFATGFALLSSAAVG